MKIKTSELTGAALDWAVAKCEGRRIESPNSDVYWPELCSFSPRQNWAQAGEIIEREGIRLHRSVSNSWWAGAEATPSTPVSGETPLIAAMRCLVTSKLGDEVDVPEELFCNT